MVLDLFLAMDGFMFKAFTTNGQWVFKLLSAVMQRLYWNMAVT